jgi:hypothetical protein
MYQKNKENSLLRSIGVYEVLGGLLGFILISYQMVLGTEIIDSKLLMIELLICCFFILNIVAGIFLFQSRKLGIWLSILCQSLQIVYLLLPTLKYVLCAGSLFGIGFKEGVFTVKFEIIYAEFLFSNDINLEGTTFLINLIPIFIIIILLVLGMKRNPALSDLQSES